MIAVAEMLRLSCLLFLVASLNRCAVQGFHAYTTAVRSKATAIIFLAATWSSDNNNDQSSDAGPQNATATASSPASPIKKTVFTNAHYTPPIIATPCRIISSRPPTKRISLDPSDKKSTQGGQYLQDIGQSLYHAGAGAKKYASITRMDHTGINEAKLFLQEAGQTLQEMGTAWQDNDWERVTYAALDASQTMELVAQSLNNIKLYTSGRKNNDLQQAFAGVGVELKCLSKKKQPKALTLQGFSLRLYQASRSFSSLVEDDKHGSKEASIRDLEKASRAAQKLAKLYGATSFYLPRRWSLWWHNRVASSKDKNDQDMANGEISEWQ